MRFEMSSVGTVTNIRVFYANRRGEQLSFYRCEAIGRLITPIRHGARQNLIIRTAYTHRHRFHATTIYRLTLLPFATFQLYSARPDIIDYTIKNPRALCGFAVLLYSLFDKQSSFIFHLFTLFQ